MYFWRCTSCRQTRTIWLLIGSQSINWRFYALPCTYSLLSPFRLRINFFPTVLFAVISAPPDVKKPDQNNDGLPVDIKLPVKHVLSRELQVSKLFSHCELFCISSFSSFNHLTWFCIFLQLYFDKVTELTLNESDSVLFKEALVSLATDSGLHPLVPYFTCFIADEVIIFFSLYHGG